MKHCNTCDTTKPSEEFYKKSTYSDGLHSNCKACMRKMRAEWRSRNPDKSAAIDARYRLNNPEKVKATNAASKARRRKEIAKYMARRLEKPQEKQAFRIRRNLRDRLMRSKDHVFFADWGCTAGEMRAHIERQFVEGMTWENYGRTTWTFDHIRPLSSFDLTDSDQFRVASHYTNVQPLWFDENIRKYCK